MNFVTKICNSSFESECFCRNLITFPEISSFFLLGTLSYHDLLLWNLFVGVGSLQYINGIWITYQKYEFHRWNMQFFIGKWTLLQKYKNLCWGITFCMVYALYHRIIYFINRAWFPSLIDEILQRKMKVC